MAGRDLHLYLRKILKEMKDDPWYTRETSNIKTHRFDLSEKNLIKETMLEFVHNKIILSPDEVISVTDSCKKYYARLKKELSNTQSKSIDLRVVDRGGDFSVTAYVREDNKNPYDVFTNFFRNKKATAQADFYKELDIIINSRGKSGWGIDETGRPFRSIGLDITHEGRSAVSKQKIGMLHTRFENSSTINDNLGFIREVGIDLSIEKNDKLDIIRISLGSKHKNRKIDGGEEGKLVLDTRKRLEQAIKDLKPYRISGSDSWLTRAKKKVLQFVENPFKALKNVTTIFENSVLEESSPKKVTVSVIPKVIDTGSTKIDALDNFPKFPVVSNINLQALIPTINESLYETIKRNMGSPKLNYQTGRFAQSARVVDIRESSQQGLTVDYTYQRYPYEVFEFPPKNHWGERLATPMRDPRLIIGQSIREIAREHIEEHFNLKRV